MKHAVREMTVDDLPKVSALLAEAYTYLEKESVLSGVMALRKNEITKLFVRPGEIRAGIGTMLFEIAQRAVARGGHDTLLVGTTGHAIPFYESMGMEVLERRTASEGPLEGFEITVLKKALHMVNTTRKLPRSEEVHL
jgi:GNAT superfamily N-acetyltransferase